MGDGYTKLFADIVDSSIWSEDSDTCKVWVTLLALSNADGLVRGSVGWLSGKAKVSPEVCSKALSKFAAPDPHSRTPDNEGRRIEFLEDGWLILNYLMFRERLSTDSQSVKTRERVKKHRDRYRALRNVTSVTSDHSASASASVQSVGVESEGGSFKSKRRFPTLEEVKLGCAKTGVPESDAIWFWNKCEGNGWTNGGKPIKSWAHTIASWKAAGYLPSQKGATGGNGTPQATVPIWRQAQAIAEQIEKHPANKDSVFHNPNATQEQKSELSKLRARLESLNRGITGV